MHGKVEKKSKLDSSNAVHGHSLKDKDSAPQISHNMAELMVLHLMEPGKTGDIPNYPQREQKQNGVKELPYSWHKSEASDDFGITHESRTRQTCCAPQSRDPESIDIFTQSNRARKSIAEKDPATSADHYYLDKAQQTNPSVRSKKVQQKNPSVRSKLEMSTLNLHSDEGLSRSVYRQDASEGKIGAHGKNKICELCDLENAANDVATLSQPDNSSSVVKSAESAKKIGVNSALSAPISTARPALLASQVPSKSTLSKKATSTSKGKWSASKADRKADHDYLVARSKAQAKVSQEEVGFNFDAASRSRRGGNSGIVNFLGKVEGYEAVMAGGRRECSDAVLPYFLRGDRFSCNPFLRMPAEFTKSSCERTEVYGWIMPEGNEAVSRVITDRLSRY